MIFVCCVSCWGTVDSDLAVTRHNSKENTMTHRILFGIWGNTMFVLFKIGMFFIRITNYRLYHSSTTGWGIDRLDRDDCKLDRDSYNRHAEMMSHFIWFLSEPHPTHAGGIPGAQYELLKQLVIGSWHGGKYTNSYCPVT